ncbi:MAG: carboxypeptidase-like regulatory domain-containing protein [bacterium]|nr:carboxypeptidase-like regulatory domain-containing protein [bacterium]
MVFSILYKNHSRSDSRAFHTEYGIRNTEYSPRARRARGVTLIDTLVASALMLVVFVGIAGVFKLSVDVITNNKARAGAIALANERMEDIRSLSYALVGTVGGIPSGSIAQSDTVVQNAITYTRRTTVMYGDDPYDGLGAADTKPASAPTSLDYKIARVDVAWESRTGTRHLTFVTRIEPTNGIETPCPVTAPCGTLAISVYNASTEPISNASVRIVNSGTSPIVDTTIYTNSLGEMALGGVPAASGYEVTVTKSGYSTDRTYNPTSQNTNPTPGPFTVSSNQTTSGTFRIDLLSSLTVNTYSLSTNSWTDFFSDESKINWQTTTNIAVSGNQARFAGNQPWLLPADLYSQTITPVALTRWGTFSWNDTRPSETTITYQVYYTDGAVTAPIPDNILTGNIAGFSTESTTSVDLSAIPADEYPSLILEAYLVAQNPNAPSPSIQDWSLTYDSGQGIAIPFTLRGAKTIGSGPSGTVYKYSQLHTTNSSGTFSLPAIEWDTYTMSVAASTGYDISTSCPTQPIALEPNSSTTTLLYLSPHTTNSLLVDVKNGTGAYLSGATVEIKKGSATQDKTADACGQAFFGGLTNGQYTVTVTEDGYVTSTTPSVDVTNYSTVSVIMESI